MASVLRATTAPHLKQLLFAMTIYYTIAMSHLKHRAASPDAKSVPVDTLVDALRSVDMGAAISGSILATGPDTVGCMLRLSPCFDKILAALIPALVKEVKEAVRSVNFSLGFHMADCFFNQSKKCHRPIISK